MSRVDHHRASCPPHDRPRPRRLDGPYDHDRDIAIIDRSRRKLDGQNAIWALAVDEIGIIKRMRGRSGTLIVQSDNDRVSDEEISLEEAMLVGRVVLVSRRT